MLSSIGEKLIDLYKKDNDVIWICIAYYITLVINVVIEKLKFHR